MGGNQEKKSAKKLINRNFRDQDLRGADFAGFDLSGADFSGARLAGADFSGAILKGAIFAAPIINVDHELLLNVNFIGADLSDSDFSQAYIKHCNFDGAFVRRAVFDGAILEFSSFVGADAQKASFHDAFLCDTSLSRGNLSFANFSEAVLGRVDFSYAPLHQAKFHQTNLLGFCFENDLSLSCIDERLAGTSPVLHVGKFGQFVEGLTGYCLGEVFVYEFEGCLFDWNGLMNAAERHYGKDWLGAKKELELATYLIDTHFNNLALGLKCSKRAH